VSGLFFSKPLFEGALFQKNVTTLLQQDSFLLGVFAKKLNFAQEYSANESRPWSLRA